MTAEPNSFDDPHLKAACCHAWKADCLPVHVRQKCFAERWREGVYSRPLAFWQRPLTGVAAAAAILLTVGVGTLEFGSTPTADASLKPQYASDLIIRHDQCCAHRRVHQLPGVAQADLPHLGQALNRSLHEPVLVSNMPENGWKFRGGTICSVAQTPAAHLIFDHHGASVSVFSLPAGWDKAPAGPFEEEVNGHAIAGFNDPRGSFMFVGSGDESLTPDHLAELRDRMSANVVNTAWDDTSDRAHFAELLH